MTRVLVRNLEDSDMTASEYKRRMGLTVDHTVIEVIDEYIPWHAKRGYTIYRVLGPGGPEERYLFTGTLGAAIQETSGCYDWCVTDILTGREVF